MYLNLHHLHTTRIIYVNRVTPHIQVQKQANNLQLQEPLASNTQWSLRFYLTTNGSDGWKEKAFWAWQLISSSLKHNTWLPHYYVFPSMAEYWFELSSYQPSEHLTKELDFVLKPSRRASKGKNSWWDTDAKCFLKQESLLQGAGTWISAELPSPG